MKARNDLLTPTHRKNNAVDRWFYSDDQFNQAYPLYIRKLAARHWTPLNVARKAAGFLAAERHTKILDIGSGVGKFCLSAAHYKPGNFFTGIEQRKNLVSYAEKARNTLQIANAGFIHANFTQVDFGDYHHFYFYNSFYENLAETDKIDHSIEYSVELYNYYTRYLYQQLAAMPVGTRLATYYSMEDEVPPSYHVVWTEMNNLLKCWIKI